METKQVIRKEIFKRRKEAETSRRQPCDFSCVTVAAKVSAGRVDLSVHRL